jgi:hypothetical protein
VKAVTITSVRLVATRSISSHQKQAAKPAAIISKNTVVP